MSDSKKVPNTAINESDDIIGGSLMDRSMLDEDEHINFDVHKEMNRKMS